MGDWRKITAVAIFWKTWFTKETVSIMISKPWACNPDWKVHENSKHPLLNVLGYRNLGKNPSVQIPKKYCVSNVSVACRGWFLTGAVGRPIRLRSPTMGPLENCRGYPPTLGVIFVSQNRTFWGLVKKRDRSNLWLQKGFFSDQHPSRSGFRHVGRKQGMAG